MLICPIKNYGFDKSQKIMSGSSLTRFHFFELVEKMKKTSVQSYCSPWIFLELDLESMIGRMVRYDPMLVAFGYGDYFEPKEKEVMRTVRIKKVINHLVILESPVHL